MCTYSLCMMLQSAVNVLSMQALSVKVLVYIRYVNTVAKVHLLVSEPETTQTIHLLTDVSSVFLTA